MYRGGRGGRTESGAHAKPTSHGKPLVIGYLLDFFLVNFNLICGEEQAMAELKEV